MTRFQEVVVVQTPRNIERAALGRITGKRNQIQHSLAMAAQGTPLAAEPDKERLRARLQKKALLTRDESAVVAHGIATLAAERRSGIGETSAGEDGAERIWGSTIDFVGIAFLERGLRAARAVARVAYRDGTGLGSGFLITPRLFLTNNHVIGAPEQAAGLVAEFDYELDAADNPKDLTRFFFDPDAFFLTEDRDDLDFTLIAVGTHERGSLEPGAFGTCRLSSSGDKHALGEIANVVQHPAGRYKEVVLRENRLVSRLDTVLHYVADTEPGSSGSPVFNNEWQVIALHHWGGPWRQKVDAAGRHVPTEVNEGIRTSAIVARLQQRLASLDAGRRVLLEQALRFDEQALPAPARTEMPAEPSARVEGDGRVTWRIPLEISVRLPLAANAPAPAAPVRVAAPVAPGASAERAIEIDENYGNRKGYNPAFLTGHTVRLPKLSSAQKAAAARNDQAGAGDDPFELKYEHFSAVLNAKRRLAFFTACNIDGPKAKSIDRKTGTIRPRKPGDDGEALDEAAEASETWFADPRADEDAQCSQDLYASQKVKNFPTGSKGWMARMFQRGHLVRRQDPVWGSDASARRAEADTFHFSNCTPQLGFFNQGTAAKSQAGGGRLWRAIEDYVLDNAVDEQKRVCVFTGPVLDDANDPLWRDHVHAGFRAPLRFWKIVAWPQDGKLHAVAMLADQGPVLEDLPEGLQDPTAEVFLDTSKVEDFVTTVAELEGLTGLDFGKTLRDADVSAGPEGIRLMRGVTSLEQVQLAPGGSRNGGTLPRGTSGRRATNGRAKAVAKR